MTRVWEGGAIWQSREEDGLISLVAVRTAFSDTEGIEMHSYDRESRNTISIPDMVSERQ